MPKAWKVRFHLRTVTVPMDNVVKDKEDAKRFAKQWMRTVHPLENPEIRGIEETKVEGTKVCETLTGG